MHNLFFKKKNIFFSLPLVTSNNYIASNRVLLGNLFLEVNISEVLVSLECFSPTDFFSSFLIIFYFS